jgi:hypothetical protein
VFERGTRSAIGAHVEGLPVYAQGATRAKAERAIRRTLAAYLKAHPDTTPTAVGIVQRQS